MTFEPASIIALDVCSSRPGNHQSYLLHEQKIVPTSLFSAQKKHLTNTLVQVFSIKICTFLRIFLCDA